MIYLLKVVISQLAKLNNQMVKTTMCVCLKK